MREEVEAEGDPGRLREMKEQAAKRQARQCSNHCNQNCLASGLMSRSGYLLPRRAG